MTSKKELLAEWGLGCRVERGSDMDTHGNVYCWNGTDAGEVSYQVHRGVAADVVMVSVSPDQVERINEVIQEQGLELDVGGYVATLVSASLDIATGEMGWNDEGGLVCRYTVRAGWNAPLNAMPSKEQREMGLPYN